MRLAAAVPVVALFSSVFAPSDDSFSPTEDPAVFYNMIELICAEGYHVQEYAVETDDGYILKIYRIPNGKRRPKVAKRRSHYRHVHSGFHPDFGDCFNASLHEAPVGPPVLLAHGVLGASDVWVLQGQDSDLAFMLADKDYDVWFSNIRGNFYSRQHRTLKPSEIAFWDFSFHENGVYDMPSTIDFILNQTGFPDLIYIGHSMGTTMFFVMASLRPEYNDKIRLFVALTPVAQMIRKNYSPSKMTVIDTVITFLRALDRIGVHELLPKSDLLNVLTSSFCRKGSPLQDLCYDLAYFHTGYHTKLFLRKKLVVYLGHSTGGSSIKTLYHFNQQLDAPFFQHYDYGPEENMRRYGQPEPPEYDLRRVTAPTALYHSKGDYISDWNDVAVIKGLLPNVIETSELPHYSHLDYLWAYNAKELVYKKVVDLVDKFRSE